MAARAIALDVTRVRMNIMKTYTLTGTARDRLSLVEVTIDVHAYSLAGAHVVWLRLVQAAGLWLPGTPWCVAEVGP